MSTDNKEQPKVEAAKAAPTELIYEPRRVKMIAPHKEAGREPANVHIVAKQTIRVGKDLMLAEGDEAFVTESQAKEFCDRTFVGNYSFGGERINAEAVRNVVRRAERVQKSA